MGQILTFLKNSIAWLRWQDILDILLVAFIFYKLMKLLKDTSAGQVLKGIGIILIVYQICGWLQLNVIYYVLTATLQIGAIALIVLFQPELRRMLDSVGRSRLPTLFSAERIQPNNETLRTISQLVETCTYMSKTKTGALIVIERETKLGEIMKTGTIINADITSELLKNIFFNKAPLHDGAVIMRDGEILAAACFLPKPSKEELINKKLGSRHRAAIGMSEVSDAIVVVVSEETGQISVAENGVLVRDYTKDKLKQHLMEQILPNPSDSWSRKPRKNPFRREKLTKGGDGK